MAPSSATGPQATRGLATSTGRVAPRVRKPTAEQALARTRELLRSHQEQARQTPRWRLLEDPHGEHHGVAENHASPEAAAMAQELHAGESRMRAIQGSASTHDRRNQRKRDHR